MTVWVDADSCPARVRDIIARAARRTGVRTVFVANRDLPAPAGGGVELTQAPSGPDGTDAWISGRLGPGDLVVTRDIPFAARLVEGDVIVLNDRGDVFERATVRERLSLRNFMQDAREAGLAEMGPRRFGDRELKAFARAFDRELGRALRRSAPLPGGDAQ